MQFLRHFSLFWTIVRYVDMNIQCCRLKEGRLNGTQRVKCAWIIKNNVVPIRSQMISIPKNFLKVSSWITWTTFLICKLSPRERNNHFWNFYSCLNQGSTPGPGIHDISRVRSLRLVPKFSIFSWSWSGPILSKFCWSWFGLVCGT